MTTFAERLHLHAHDLDADGHDTTGGGSALTVRDVDGTPTVTPVDTLMFTNGTVTDNGGGSVTVTIAGSSLAVDGGGTPVTGVTSITFDGAEINDNGGGSINVNIIPNHEHEIFNDTGDGTEDEFTLSGLEGATILLIDVFVSGVLLTETDDYSVDYMGTPDTLVTFVTPPINLAPIRINVVRA